jgi:eukaryotic-like serine/threonine-protein kinase
VQLAEIDVGRIVAGKYELVRLLGKGAMGEVWLATHNSLGGEFAVKLVRPSEAEEEGTAAGRFQLEAQVSARLSRKTRHIVSVSDHGEENGLAYLVMERLEGESLEAHIERPGRLDLPEVVAIVMQIARALAHAHSEGIFHRDLKPANLFLTRDEDGRMLVKLLDFGIARAKTAFASRSPFATGKDMVLGTPSYMSPEQARGLDTLDYRCDLWALAVVAYEALTGTIPWEGERLEDIFLSICTHRMTPIVARRADLPPGIEGIFARAFAPALDDRFQTADALSEAFEALVDPAAVEAAMGGARPVTRSSPDLAAAAAMLAPSGGSPNAWHRARHRVESSADPVGVAMGEPTRVAVRRRRSAGWVIAAIAALTALGVVGLALSAFTSRDTPTSRPTASSAPPTTPSTGQALLAPPEPATATVVAEPAAPPTTTTAQSPHTAGRPSPRASVTVVPVVASPVPTPAPSSPPAPAVAVVTAAPSPPPQPRPSATATVPKPRDKGEVF